MSERDNMLAAWQGETYDSQITTASVSGDDSADKAANESSVGQPSRRDSVRAPARAAFHVSQAQVFFARALRGARVEA